MSQKLKDRPPINFEYLKNIQIKKDILQRYKLFIEKYPQCINKMLEGRQTYKFLSQTHAASE